MEYHFSIIGLKAAHYPPLLLHPFCGLFSISTWVSQCQKDKTSLDLGDAIDDWVFGSSGISWSICKHSAPRFRQITTPAPHHSSFTGTTVSTEVSTIHY